MPSRNKFKYCIFALVVCGIVLSGLIGIASQIVPVFASSLSVAKSFTGNSTPAPTLTLTPARTPKTTPRPTYTPTPTSTPKPTPTPPPVFYPTPTPTHVHISTSTPTPVSTPVAGGSPVPTLTAHANQTPTPMGKANIIANNNPPGGSSPGSPWTNALVYLFLFIILSAGAALVFIVKKTHIFG